MNTAYYEYEVTLTSRISVFKHNPYATVYDILCPQEVKVRAVEKLRHASQGDFYALWQTPYFLVRGALERIFPAHDFRRMWNPLGWLRICSEGTYEELMDIAISMNWVDLIAKLKEWRPNTFHSGDFREVLDWMVSKGYARIIDDPEEDIPFGSMVSWAIPPQLNGDFFIRVFGYLQVWGTRKIQTHSSTIMSKYPELNPIWRKRKQ